MIESYKYYLYEIAEGRVIVKFSPRLADDLIIVTLESELPEDLNFENSFIEKTILRCFDTITHFQLTNDGGIYIDDFIVPPALRKKGLGQFILKKAISAFGVSPTTKFYGKLSSVDIPKKSVQFWSKVLDTNAGILVPATEKKDGYFEAPLR